jgi:hypothetical protein
LTARATTPDNEPTMADESIARKELREVFEDLDSLLKNPEVGTELASRGVNISLAIVAAEALHAYVVDGDKARAAEDFETVAEEIATRHAASAASKGDGAARNDKKEPS